MQNYGIAIAAIIAAVLLRWLLDPVIGNAFPLVTLFGAVAAAVWVGGLRPAIVATILGYLACAYLFIEPRGQLAFHDPGFLVGLAAYLFTCSLIIGIGEAMRHAQQQANQRGEMFAVTLRSIGDAVITTDVEGRITALNAVAESLTGWTEHEAVGQPLDRVFQIVNETTRQPVENPATRALREGIVVGLANHTVLLKKSGGELPIDDSAAPIRDDQGRVSGCVLIFRDVSYQRSLEREKTGQLLSARLLASIVASSDDAIISKTLDGTIQSWNAAAERLFGYTAAQAVGRHISLVIPPERLSEEDLIISRLKAGERIEHFDTVRMRSDGRQVLVSLTISPIRDEEGMVVGASKIVRDVTSQRQAEERERQLLGEAAEANTKFRAFFDQGTIFAGLVDLNGKVMEVNRLALEACGYTREQAIDKPFWEGPWWRPMPTLVERVQAAYNQAATGETFRDELPYFVADGSERVADVTILPIKDEAGRVLFIAPTGIDVTDRKRSEAERTRLEDNLRKLAADLSEADRRKDEFLATLAHELRNPLAPIRNALQILAQSDDPEDTRPARALMERQLEQMVRLVDDLLDVSRISRGRLELRREQVPLAKVIHSAIETSRPVIDRMSQNLTVTMPPETIVVDADLVRLAQVFANLLNNSAKYMDRGRHIWLTVDRQGGEVVISVKDEGIGIAASQLPHIFEMFSQVDGSLERSQGGLGIGLTLVKRLVEMHGGRIEVHSPGLGQGAEFIVRLPVIVPSPVCSEPSGNGDTVNPKSALRILIVDDNRDGADSLAMLLRFMGNETRTAYDGQEGVEVAAEFRPAVILLDIGLPRLNGNDACRQLRAQPWGKQTIIIAVTGWGQDEDRRLTSEAGFDHHMVKPVNPKDLMQLLAGFHRTAALPSA